MPYNVWHDLIDKSSHQRCSVRKGVFRNFTKFTGKHLCQSPFLNKVAGLGSATLLKKATLAQVFSCEFREISKNTFFTEQLWMAASIDYLFSSLILTFQLSVGFV